MKIIIMHLVFFSTVKCSRKEDFIRFNIFYYVATLVPSWGLNPWPGFHEIHNFGRPLYGHLTMHYFFLNMYGSKEWFFFNLAVFAHLTLPIALKGLQSQSFHKLDFSYHKDVLHCKWYQSALQFSKRIFFKKKYSVIQKEVFLQNGIP